MNIYRYLQRLKNEERGAVVIIFALMMVVIIGFAALSIDLGLAYNEASKLQIGLDSIALAAVRNYPLLILLHRQNGAMPSMQP